MTKDRKRLTLGGVGIEMFAAVGTVVLAIISLAGLFPAAVGGVVAIALGVALLFEGLSVGSMLERRFSVEDIRDRPLIGDVSLEAVAGLGTIVIAIIALANQSIATGLLPAAAITAGAGMLFASYPVLATTTTAEGRRMEEVLEAASGAHALAGVGAMVLGIIALVVSAAVTVSLVAYLVLGATLMLGSAAVGRRFVK